MSDDLESLTIESSVGSQCVTDEASLETPATPVELSLTAKVEALLFASPKPLRAAEIAELLQGEVPMREIEAALSALVGFFAERGGGFKLEYLGRMGYQFRTVAEAASLMERQFAARPRPLTRAALETLAIVAYRQPVTRAEIEYVRGVDAGSIIKALMDRDLIACVGRKQDSGRPMLFGTTEEFLKVFGLNHVTDLPPVEAFQPPVDMLQGALEKVAGEEPVDLEPFIADPEVSLGLDDDFARVGARQETPAPGDWETLAEGTEAIADPVSPKSSEAAADKEQEDTYGAGAYTQVDSPIGSSLPPGSGEVDHGGEGFD